MARPAVYETLNQLSKDRGHPDFCQVVSGITSYFESKCRPVEYATKINNIEKSHIYIFENLFLTEYVY
jgi:hypothetical protein